MKIRGNGHAALWRGLATSARELADFDLLLSYTGVGTLHGYREAIHLLSEDSAESRLNRRWTR